MGSFMKRKQINWPQVEAEYRTGTYSNRGLAARYGISEGAIRHRVKIKGMTKDLKATTQERTKKRLRSSHAREQKTKCVNKNDGRRRENKTPIINPPTTIEQKEAELALTESATKEAVNTKVTVVEIHRLDIKRARTLLEMQIAELALVTVTQAELTKMAEEQCITINDDGVQVKDFKKLMLFNRALSLNERSATLRNLSFVLEKVITLERQAFGIEDIDTKDDGSPDTILIGDYRPEDGLTEDDEGSEDESL